VGFIVSPFETGSPDAGLRDEHLRHHASKASSVAHREPTTLMLTVDVIVSIDVTWEGALRTRHGGGEARQRSSLERKSFKSL
jgi:hypothetical protein